MYVNQYNIIIQNIATLHSTDFFTQLYFFFFRYSTDSEGLISWTHCLRVLGLSSKGSVCPSMSNNERWPYTLQRSWSRQLEQHSHFKLVLLFLHFSNHKKTWNHFIPDLTSSPFPFLQPTCCCPDSLPVWKSFYRHWMQHWCYCVLSQKQSLQRDNHSAINHSITICAHLRLFVITV